MNPKIFGDGGRYRIHSSGLLETCIQKTGCKGAILGDTWRPIKACFTVCDQYGGGYWAVNICTEKGKTKKKYIHRLVAEYFIKEIPKGMQVNHIDGNRNNNNLSNLEICTPSENIQNALSRGILFGAKKYKGKMDEFKALSILTLVNSGFEYKTISDYYKMDNSVVSKLSGFLDKFSYLREKRIINSFLDITENLDTAQ